MGAIAAGCQGADWEIWFWIRVRVNSTGRRWQALSIELLEVVVREVVMLKLKAGGGKNSGLLWVGLTKQSSVESEGNPAGQSKKWKPWRPRTHHVVWKVGRWPTCNQPTHFAAHVFGDLADQRHEIQRLSQAIDRPLETNIVGFTQ
jgi:hypothetical protein